MNDYINLRDYNFILDKDLKINYICFFTILVIVLFLFYILMFIKIDDYYINECIVKEDLLVCSVKHDDLKYIVNNKKLYIDNVPYKYEIYSINEEIERINDTYFKEINLEINLDNYNIDNNILKIKVKVYHDNLLNYIKETIGGKYEKNR